MAKLNNNSLNNVGQCKNKWHKNMIKDQLVDVLNQNPLNWFILNWDKINNVYYINDNECYLNIDDGVIWIGSNRENVFSSDVHLKYHIDSKMDIDSAYKKFFSMTCEDEE